MMELYIIRHGIAADKKAYSNDAERPLTEKGIKQTGKVAKQLNDRGLRFNLILSSPLVRAKETAVILQEAGLCSVVEENSSLAPDGEIKDWVNWLQDVWQNPPQDRCLALVGHQPNLGIWAETLVWGYAKEKLILKKAGVIGLKIPSSGTPIGESEIFLLTSPKWIL